MICIGITLLAARKVKLFGAIKENFWLFLLIAYMLLSILWSDIPYISFKRWVRELGTVVMALVLLTERNPRQAVHSVLRRSVYILIPFSLLLIKYFPVYGVAYGQWFGDRRWLGVTVDKNGLGRLCLISSFFLIWTFIVRWRKRDILYSRWQLFADITVLLIALYLFKGPPGAYPATATGALVVAVFSLFVLLLLEKWHMRLPATLPIMVVTAFFVLGYVTPIVGGATVGDFSDLFGRDATLTGRTDIWARLLPWHEQSPIIGYGFGSFWTPSMQEAVYGIREAHNGYLEVCLGIGVIGLLLTAMFLLSFVRKVHSTLAHDYDWASLCLCFLLITLVHNITESSIDSFGYRQLMAVLLFLSFCLPKKRDIPEPYRSSVFNVSSRRGGMWSAGGRPIPG
jgi:exopolysaccharide production protein ExoQ